MRFDAPQNLVYQILLIEICATIEEALSTAMKSSVIVNANNIVTMMIQLHHIFKKDQNICK